MKRFVYINDDDQSHDLYCDNRISNRKYTVLNFLPKNLWEQFSRFMNQYFLLIACLQLWPLITPVNPASTWGPLLFIFAVSATKEAWDDYNRYVSDKKANEKQVWVVKKGVKKHIRAQDIHVGNLVWLRENDEVPCDLVLIGTSEPQGLCHIETSALDGETDLKTRVIASACAGIELELLHKIKARCHGVIECPPPDKDIRRFDANMRLFPPFLDNDDDVDILFSGNETKLGMSRGVPEPKLTAMDAMIDKLTGAIFVFQVVVVIVLGVAGNVWKDMEARKQWYVQYPNEGPWYELLVIPLRFELLCSIMIPISIKVSLDLVKSLYAKFIDWDQEMMDTKTGTPSHAANTAISEDLGQVEYILTDKTGTLTENKMIFKRCCISGTFYGNETGDALKDVKLLNAVSGGSSDVIRFLTVMSICNTVIPVQSKNGVLSYKAQSQDEEALVRAASQLHMVFVKKNASILEINFNASLLQYELLDTLEFTSDRKKMSIVWRVSEVCQRLEVGLEILGVAAIEDRLQDGVPETIETLRKAGINFWMLTGDKQNTAIQIALSCNFVSPEPKGQLLLINGKTEDEVCRSLERVLLTMRITNSEPKDVAFVIDGWALEIALKHHRKAFTELSILSRTAICCRVTPSQKAQLVGILKSCDYRTLAIGDGGNDVRMIQQADIGVGISGREGLQAARAADYSIGKFRFLKRLILVHGRYSYNRTAFLSQYSFYKSLLICFIQIFIPVLVSVLDKDLSERTVMQHPQILFYCQAGRLLNPSTFAGWFGRALFHAIVVFLITIHAYANEKSEIEEVSMVALSGCIWLQAFVVAIETNSFTILQHLAIWGNLLGFYVINWIISSVPAAGMYTIMFRLCGQPSYWITMFLIVVCGMGPVIALKYFRYTYRSSKINILQQAERLGGPILSLGSIETQQRSLERELSALSISQPKSRSPVYEPLLLDSPSALRRSFGPGPHTDFRTRNYKDN
uniref:Uncharacterized protein n=1 Tax=Daucus carota subsp. sativus TaxID=79200 RepID=A0A166FRT8_DAUCS